ncbi:hypothetical protein LOTGIDRAFT_125374, partial [Lottia gigantea]
RSKRQLKSVDDGHWDCSVCTYSNSPEAYKCEMCDVRKGTSTRKPRLNSQLVAQQVAQQFPLPGPPPSHSHRREKSHSSGQKNKVVNGKRRSRLKNIDRLGGEKMEVTVNDVTVLITDYKPKQLPSNMDNSSDTSDTNSSITNDNEDLTSDTSAH